MLRFTPGPPGSRHNTPSAEDRIGYQPQIGPLNWRGKAGRGKIDQSKTPPARQRHPGRCAVGSYSGVPGTESGINNTVAMLTVTAISTTASSHIPNTNRAYRMDVEAHEKG